MRGYWTMAIALLPAAAAAQELPVTREGIEAVLTQYFAGADRDHDGKLDREEAAAAMGVARSVLNGQRDEEPFTVEVAPDGRAKLKVNKKGPLGEAGRLDIIFDIADRDEDGALSLAEVKAVAGQAFELADRNHDGVLDEEERQAVKQRLGMLKGLLSGLK